MKTKYSKTTQGLEAQVFVAKAIAYSTIATYKTFYSGAADGEIGVFITFKASGPTTYTEANAIVNPSDTALAAGDKFFIAQMQIHVDSFGVTRRLIHKTPVYTYSENTVRAVAYSAPVAQVTNIGYNGTSGSMNSGTLITGQIFPIKLIENTPGNEPYPKWNYEEVAKQGDTLIKIGARLLKQFNDPLQAQNQYNGRVAYAEMLTDGTFSASSGGSFTVTNGDTIITVPESAGAAADAGKYAADASTMVVGDYLRIGGTAATSPVYKIAAITGAGTALCTITLDCPYQGATATVTAANVGEITATTVIGFKLTGLTTNTMFVVALDEDIASADLVYTTSAKVGIGSSDQVTQIEKEGQIFAGYTTGNEAFTEDYGQPASYVVSATTYQFIYLDYLRTLPAVAAPVISDRNYGHIILCLPVGVAPTSDLDGMFV